MRIILALVVALAALGTTPARAAAPVEAGKVYSGPEGEEVAVVPLTPREDKKFLLRVQGTGSELDGKVLRYQVNDWSNRSTVRQSYYTQLRGRDYSALVAVGTNYELHVPGRSNAIAMKYDEARTKALKADEVYAQHQKQDKEGLLAKLMAFDRKGEMARHDTEYAAELKALNASCGSSVAATIDWSTVTDDLLKGYSISSFCGAPVTSLRALCDVSDEAKRTVKAKVKQIDCRFGAALEPKLQADKVVWTTAKDAANQTDIATRFFKQNL